MTNTTDARAERSRQALIQAGMVLLAENREASLSDVAQAAGVGRATLYRHFETREQLIEAISIQCVDTFEKETAPIENEAETYLDAVRLLIEKVMPLNKELSFIMKLDSLIDGIDTLTHLYKEQDKATRDLLRQCQKEKSIRQDVPVDWLSAFLDSLFIAAWRMVNEFNTSHREAASFAFDSFCSGVARSK